MPTLLNIRQESHNWVIFKSKSSGQRFHKVAGFESVEKDIPTVNYILKGLCNLRPCFGSPALNLLPRITKEISELGPNLPARLSLSEKPHQARHDSHNRCYNRTNRIRNDSPTQKLKARSRQLQTLNESALQQPCKLANSRPELLKESSSLSQARKHFRKASPHQRLSDTEKFEMLSGKRGSLTQLTQAAGGLANRPDNRIHRFHAHKSKHKGIHYLLILTHKVSKSFKNRNKHFREDWRDSAKRTRE